MIDSPSPEKLGNDTAKSVLDIERYTQYLPSKLMTKL